MTNVIQFNAPKKGDLVFILCPCDLKDPVPYLAQVVVQEEPIICGLVCPKCETYLPVLNGYIQKAEEKDGEG